MKFQIRILNNEQLNIVNMLYLKSQILFNHYSLILRKWVN